MRSSTAISGCQDRPLIDKIFPFFNHLVMKICRLSERVGFLSLTKNYLVTVYVAKRQQAALISSGGELQTMSST